MKARYSFSSRRTRHTENIRKQRGKYPLITAQIIGNSDIILEVLDARFIDETRNPEIEEEIKKKNKKLIYVFNKTDLGDIKKIRDFNYLSPNVSVSCKKRGGIKELRNLIKRISKKIETKNEKIIVGVIGYPNTGKSSLINLLIGKSSAGVGAEAGFTKSLQKLRLSKDIVLLDSPGVIPESEYSSTNKEKISKHTKLGARSYSQIKEPEIVVTNLMKDYSKQIENFYNVKTGGNAEILIEKLGKKKSLIKKGGKVDEDKTARMILRDWQNGKIKI